MYLFADDAKIYKSFNSLNDHDILHYYIDDLPKWHSDWLLTFNPDKCNVFEVAKHSFKDYDYVIILKIVPCGLYPMIKTWGNFHFLTVL